MSEYAEPARVELWDVARGGHQPGEARYARHHASRVDRRPLASVAGWLWVLRSHRVGFICGHSGPDTSRTATRNHASDSIGKQRAVNRMKVVIPGTFLGRRERRLVSRSGGAHDGRQVRRSEIQRLLNLRLRILIRSRIGWIWRLRFSGRFCCSKVLNWASASYRYVRLNSVSGLIL
jgi:hypothetical protein